MSETFSTHISQARLEHHLPSDTKKVRLYGEGSGGSTNAVGVDSDGRLSVLPSPRLLSSELSSDGSQPHSWLTASYQLLSINGPGSFESVYLENDTDAQVLFAWGDGVAAERFFIRLGPGSVKETEGTCGYDLYAKHDGTPPTRGAVIGNLIR